MHSSKPMPAIDPAKLISVSLDLRRFAEALLTPAATEAIDAADVRRMIRLRRERDKYFDERLFADPAWDMLLDLYAARLEGRRVSVSSLCTAAAVPPTTALRWITLLCARGLLLRAADPADGRRILIEISDDAAERMGAYFSVSGRRTEAGI